MYYIFLYVLSVKTKEIHVSVLITAKKYMIDKFLYKADKYITEEH